ncbi:hypothetical protein CEXT_10571 [Caerostris extrusa]|uniref:Uncharacterized protein n=1 Tax=Caerostris extrusa TaxID=172846 RepID=A0AAV4U5E5_CAEEX|nr:hypothetical protein CEXT_10571 [Caerostris extrusa]
MEARNVSRFLRLCVLIFCLCGFLYYTTAFLMKYWQYPTVMDVVVDYPEEIELPCSHNLRLQCDSIDIILLHVSGIVFSFIKIILNFARNIFIFVTETTSTQAVSPYELPKLSRAEHRYKRVWKPITYLKKVSADPSFQGPHLPSM